MSESKTPKDSGSPENTRKPGTTGIEEPRFSEAMAELEGILRRIESEEIDIDDLATELRRATELLDLARSKIKKAEVEVIQIVESLDEGDGDGG